MRSTTRCAKNRAVPKFKVGDVVAEKPRNQIVATSHSAEKHAGMYARPRLKGIVVEVRTKADRRGSSYFFYKIKWCHNGITSEHAQMRLQHHDGFSE